MRHWYWTIQINLTWFRSSSFNLCIVLVSVLQEHTLVYLHKKHPHPQIQNFTSLWLDVGRKWNWLSFLADYEWLTTSSAAFIQSKKTFTCELSRSLRGKLGTRLWCHYTNLLVTSEFKCPLRNSAGGWLEEGYAVISERGAYKDSESNKTDIYKTFCRHSTAHLF